jgi:hypothetical protein
VHHPTSNRFRRPLASRRRSWSACRRYTYLAAALALGVLTGCATRAKPWDGISPAARLSIEHFKSVGIAQYENERREDAAAAFGAIARAAPRLAFGYANQAAALMQLNHPTEALQAAEQAARLLPDDPGVGLVLAEAQQESGRTEDAIRTLEGALPQESGATAKQILGQYRLVELYRMSGGDHQAQIAGLRERLARELPENTVAQLEWAQAAAQAGKVREARAALERVQTAAGTFAPGNAVSDAAWAALKAGNGRAAVAPLQVLRNLLVPTPRYRSDRRVLAGAETDPRGLILREFDPPPPALPDPPLPESQIRFTDVTTAWGLPSAPARVGHAAVGHPITVADYDGDNRPDLFVADPGGHSRLWHNTGHSFVDVTARAGLPPIAALSAQFVDVDNDHRLDLVLVTPAGLRYFRGSGGAFRDAGRLPAPPGPLAQVLFADLDIDGDLDYLLLPGEGPPRLYRNNGDGSFTNVAAKSGLAAPFRGGRAVVFGDFDENGAPDLLLLSEREPARLYLDQYGARFRSAPEFGATVPAGAAAAVVDDFNRDGALDVAVVGRLPATHVLLQNEGGRRFRPTDALRTALGDFRATGIAVLDADGDGWRDLVVTGDHGTRLLRNVRGQGFQDRSAALPALSPASGVAVADLDGDGDADLVLSHPGGGVTLLRNDSAGSNHWCQVQLSADRPGAANNKFGFGATVELKAPGYYARQLVVGPVTLFGLGRLDQLDAMRIVWSNGTPQNVLAPKTDQLLEELIAPGKSCPFLYAWDGERYRFVTDCLWRSPLGLRVSTHRFAPHNQTLDWVKIPREALRPTEGFFDLAISEELWETTYLDMADLVAVDHPEAAELFLDERMNFGPPLSFVPYTVRHPRTPRSVTDHRARSWLAEVRRRDGVYSHAFELTRYQGITLPSELVMDLGPLPPGAPVRLFMTGWIFPSNSSSNVAASQDHRVRVVPPRVAVADRCGHWKTIIPALGLPTGKNKTVVVELGRFEGGQHRVKLTTTAQLYWDQIFFTVGETPSPVRLTRLRPMATDLHYLGFSAMYRKSDYGPFLHDRERVDRTPRWRCQEGWCTRYGDVTPLLQRVDDQYVILNTGDEVWMRYDGRRLPSLPAGWGRDFVLLTDGWDKDADPNTETGTTVLPLPFHGMKHYPYGPGEPYPDTPELRQYQRTYNTRWVSALSFRQQLIGAQGSEQRPAHR